jgi:hypothetical protein
MSRTIFLLKTIPKTELTAFGKFLQSPFFTQKTYLFDLFQEIIRHKQGFEAIISDQEKLFSKLFPKTTFNETKWKKILSDLNQLIEMFLAVRRLQDDENLKKAALVDAYFDQAQEAFFDKELNYHLRALTTSDDSVERWHQQYWTAKKYFSYPHTDRTKDESDLVQKLDLYLDVYYWVAKLQLACNKAIRANFLSEPENITLSNWLLEHTQGYSYQLTPLLVLYRDLLKLLIHLDADAFLKYIEYLKKNLSHIESGEQETLVRYALSMCIRLSRMGEKLALQWYAEILNWSLETGIGSVTLNVDTFVNHGLVFLQNNAYPDFHQFLKTNLDKLPEDRKEDTAFLLMAFFYFRQKDYKNVQANLLRISTRNVRFTYRIQSLLIRNTYHLVQNEQENRSELKRILKNYEDYFKGKHEDFSKEFIQQFLELGFFIQQLEAFTNESSKKNWSLAQFQLEIEQRQPACRDWIEAQLAALSLQK